jgi:hypothetical protein
MLLEILGATVQILIRPGDQVPEICAPLLQTVLQVKPPYHSFQFSAVTLRRSDNCHFILNNGNSVRVCSEYLFLNTGVPLHF